MFGGYPVGIMDVVRLQRFSMFLPAPIIGTLLLIYLVSPAGQKLLLNNPQKMENQASASKKVMAGI
jgi:subtilisin-like proprotein convertase family protein